MRLLLAGTLAAATAAGLAMIRPAILTDEERTAARAIQAGRMRADVRFLSSDELRDHAPGSAGDRLVRAYLSSRLEAIGLAPGAAGESWEQAIEFGGHKRSANVIGRLEGRDPELHREAVVYSAHLSRAFDGAAGLAALLAVAEAFAALPRQPRRSVLFAAVVDEQQGLPGATLLASRPPAPVERFVAHLDLDGAGLQGHPREVPVIGLGRSSLDGWIRTLAEAQERTVAPEALPDEGNCHPSSRLSFARAGVPTACLGAGTDVEDVQLAFFLGAKVAEAPLAPVGQPVEGLDPAVLAADQRR